MMRARLFARLLLLASSLFTTPAAAYFVIELRDGAEVRANFVREEAGGVYAAREAGELRIEKPRIRSIREVDPGAQVDVAKPVAAALGAPSSPPPATAVAPPASVADRAERERQVTRKIIYGQRDLLFAKLLGESPEQIEKRERELKALKGERAEIQKQPATPAQP